MYFQKINIPVPKWNLDGIVIPEAGSNLYEKHFRNVEQIVPTDFLEKLRTVDMVPEYVRLFVWPRNFCGQWHIDGDCNTPRYSCMNWIINGAGLIQFNPDAKLKITSGVHRGSGGLTSPDEFVAAETNGHGYVINSGSPHRVLTKEDGRTSISLSYKNKDVLFTKMVEKLHLINII
jgi:hypothetical protein